MHGLAYPVIFAGCDSAVVVRVQRYGARDSSNAHEHTRARMHVRAKIHGAWSEALQD